MKSRKVIYRAVFVTFAIANFLPLNVLPNSPFPLEAQASDRIISMPVTLKEDGKRALGEVSVRISMATSQALSVSKTSLLKAVRNGLRKPVLAAIGNAPSRGGFISLKTLNNMGIKIAYDGGLLELHLFPTVEQRPYGAVSMAGKARLNSTNLSTASKLSGYLNVNSVADYFSGDNNGDNGLTAPRFNFDSALFFNGWVLENGFTLEDNAKDGDRFRTSINDFEFHRERTRLVYDRPDDALRFKLGDIDPEGLSYQGSPDVLGLSVEKSYRKLQPGQNIRPTGRTSFRLDRSAQVEVQINGRTVKRLNLNAGEYDLSDLPLRTGANDITLIIKDDVGQERTLKFSTFFGRSLLAKGRNEWSGAAGVRSGRKDKELVYYKDDWYASGFYRKGLTNALTGLVHFQLDNEAVMGGTGADIQTKFGFFSVEGSASHHQTFGTGMAASVNWALLNVEDWDGERSSFQISADFRSKNFVTAGWLNQVNNPYWLVLNSSYSRSLFWDFTGSLSGRYSFADEDGEADRYALDIGLGRALGHYGSLNLTAGYSSEISSFSDLTNDKDDNGEFHAGIRVSFKLGAKSYVSADYDTKSERSHVSYSKQVGSGVGQWDLQADIEHDNDDKTAGVAGALSYFGNRGTASISHDVHTSNRTGRFTDNDEHQTTLRLSTAFAFSGDSFAMGRPVRGAFAIVNPHISLTDSDVIIGSGDDIRAYSDGFGSALVSGLSPYSLTRIGYDVNNLPVGYDLGAGAFDVLPSYKAGYNLVVGSSYTVSAYGLLLDHNKKPVSLLTGTAYENGDKNGRQVEIFTNGSGKFGAQGLAPGRWLIEMATEPVTRYAITVPKETIGLYKAGTLTPQ